LRPAFIQIAAAMGYGLLFLGLLLGLLVVCIPRKRRKNVED
jgi:hypothetical protein